MTSRACSRFPDLAYSSPRLDVASEPGAPSKHLWAENYERDSRDVLAMQDELASAISHQINIALTPDEQARLANARSVNPQAVEA